MSGSCFFVWSIINNGYCADNMNGLAVHIVGLAAYVECKFRSYSGINTCFDRFRIVAGARYVFRQGTSQAGYRTVC